MRISMTLLLFLWTMSIWAQPQTPAVSVQNADLPFYKNQSQDYSNWLAEQGWSSVLKVHDVIIRNDSLILYLAFTKDDFKWQINAWDQLKTSFEATGNSHF